MSSDEEFEVANESGNEEARPSQEDRSGNQYVKCRARKLVKLISELSDAQREAVSGIGFGGVLELKLNRFPIREALLFVKAFDDGSYVFRASTHKEFLVTKHDVQDCFLLPIGPNELPIIPAGRFTKQMEDTGVAAEFRELKKKWRVKYDISKNNNAVPLGKVYDRIKEDKEGGDEFCRNFVLFCMSSFLCPTSNSTVDIKLLKAVEDVSAINQYDWCSYVLNGMVKAAADYKKDPAFLVGCIPFLMITYFQRFDFRAQICPHDLPLIKHWDEKKIVDRIKGELQSGSLGRQSWSVVKYPRCLQDTNLITKAETPLKLGYTCTGSEENTLTMVVTSPHPNRNPKFTMIEIPPGVEDDVELKARAVDDLHELYLKMQRNALAFHAWYVNASMKIKQLTSDLSDPTSGVPSQSTQAFLEDERLHKYVDEVVDGVTRMKNTAANAPTFSDGASERIVQSVLDDIEQLNEMEDVIVAGDNSVVRRKTTVKKSTPAALTTELVTSTDQPVKKCNQPPASKTTVKKSTTAAMTTESVTSTDHLVKKRTPPPEIKKPAARKGPSLSDSEGSIKKRSRQPLKTSTEATPIQSVPSSDPSPIKSGGKISPNSKGMSAVKSTSRGKGDGLGCSLDCGLIGSTTDVVSRVLRLHKFLLKEMPNLRKHVLDYCLLDDHDLDPSECVANYGTDATLSRADIMSMLPNVDMSDKVIDCWSILMNKIECEESEVPRMAFFGIRHMEVLKTMMETHDRSTPIDTNVDTLMGHWDAIVNACGKATILNADLLFIPIKIEGRFSCVCINFKISCVLLLDNQFHTDWENSPAALACKTISTVMSDYLESRGARIGSFENTLVSFQHRQLATKGRTFTADNYDTGICTMMQMLLYEGKPFQHKDLETKTGRRFLSFELAASLVLADVNQVRGEVMNKVSQFIAEKDGIWKNLYAKRRVAQLLSKK